MKKYSFTAATIGLIFFASLSAQADSYSSAMVPGKSYPGVADANAPFTLNFVQPVSIPGETLPDHALIPSLGIVHEFFPSFTDIAGLQEVPAIAHRSGVPELSVASGDGSQATAVIDPRSSGLNGSSWGNDLSIARISPTSPAESKKLTLNNKLIASLGMGSAVLSGRRGQNELTGDLSIGSEKIPEQTPVADIAFMVLMGTGLIGLAGLSRRRKNR